MAGMGAAYGVQRHYDTAYVRCMYSAGHRGARIRSHDGSVRVAPYPAAASRGLPPPATGTSGPICRRICT